MLTSGFVVAVALLALSFSLSGETGFIDVDAQSPHREDIEWLADQGITRGCNPPDGDRFCPDDPVSRGALMAVLHRAFPAREIRDATATFVDAETSEFRSDINWAAASGLSKGCNAPLNDWFCPGSSVTRGEVAAFLSRTLDLTAGTHRFVDSIGHRFEDELGRLWDAGITRGCNPPSNDRVCPDAPITRAELASMLHRAIEPEVSNAGGWSGPASMRSLSIERQNGAFRVGFCANRHLAFDDQVTRVVIVIHGTGRNACGYADAVLESAELAGSSTGLVVMAPLFASESEADGSGSEDLYWEEAGWKAGEASLGSPPERPWSVSSFEVVDELVAEARGAFPALVDVVVAGHSAGGQFVNRYAAATDADVDRFVVANPSSYLYLDNRRWSGSQFTEPAASDREDCPGFNEWKYGLEERPEVVADVDAATLRRNLFNRTMVFLVGLEDVEQDDDLDTRCQAMLQGSDRLDRGRLYYRSLGEVLGPETYTRHRLVEVPGVGHSAGGVFTSEAGRDSLFGTSAVGESVRFTEDTNGG